MSAVMAASGSDAKAAATRSRCALRSRVWPSSNASRSLGSGPRNSARACRSGMPLPRAAVRRSAYELSMAPWPQEPEGSAAGAVMKTGPDDQRQELHAGGTVLDLGAHGRANPALVARGPAAILDLGRPGRVDRVLPVLPQPVTVKPGVEVVPGQDLLVAAFSRGVPIEVDRVVAEGRARASFP